MTRRLFLLIVALLIACVSGSAQSTSIRIGGDVPNPITVSAADVASIPHVSVTISGRGSPTTYEGVLLIELLKRAGAPSGDTLRGAELARYVVVTGADGYRAVFALAELDPAFTEHPLVLADRRDGAALAENALPFVVVAPS